MKIHRTGNKSWTNCHETFTQSITDLYDLSNNQTASILNDFNDSMAGIQGIIGEAITNGKKLRAVGGGWSWTKVAATDGILLNTKPLNLSFKISQNNVSPNYAKAPEDLFFAQCGVSVKELNDTLKSLNRSLRTSGASNGQTIAGAVSTGTHGSAIDVGSVQDFVVGLHIIVSPTRHVWLERASYPVVSDSFVANINAEPIRNDEWFNAALVSFGSFGFIHGVMIETEPIFLYESYRVRVPLDNSLLHIMETLDFSNAQLPQGNERPYHFQVLINQFDLANGAYVNVMYKRPFAAYDPPAVTIPGIAPGDDAPAFIGKITQAAPLLVPLIVNKLIKETYPLFSNVKGTHGEIFPNIDFHGKVLSAAIGVPLNFVIQLKDLLIALNKSDGPFCGVFAFRYVKGTNATLGFTRFSHTCVVEFDAVHSNQALGFYNKLWDKLDAMNVPYTFHWGKVLKLDNARLRKSYGDNKVDEWITSRNDFIDDVQSLAVFNNELISEWGLDAIIV